MARRARSYPTGENSYVNSAGQTVDLGNWAPANDGLRNLTGRVSANGTVDPVGHRRRP